MPTPIEGLINLNVIDNLCLPDDGLKQQVFKDLIKYLPEYKESIHGALSQSIVENRLKQVMDASNQLRSLSIALGIFYLPELCRLLLRSLELNDLIQAQFYSQNIDVKFDELDITLSNFNSLSH